jgi:mitogen-activated protein kinase 1/3
MWAIGCIFAELMGMMREHVENYTDRKPFFPGQSCFPLSPCKKRPSNANGQASYPNDATDQLNMIFEVIGTPESRDLSHITDKRVLYYLSTFSKKPRRDLSLTFPAASLEAIDLLAKLLTFNPNYRISCEDALKHSFFDKVRHFGDSSASPNTNENPGFFKKATPVSHMHMTPP